MPSWGKRLLLKIRCLWMIEAGLGRKRNIPNIFETTPWRWSHTLKIAGLPSRGGGWPVTFCSFRKIRNRSQCLCSQCTWGCLITSWNKQHSYLIHIKSVQFSSVAQSCPTLCDPMNCSTPGLPVHHWLPEFTQTHVHWVGDAIQPSHPLSSPSPPALNLSQHQGLFKWVSSSHQVAKVLEFQL